MMCLFESTRTRSVVCQRVACETERESHFIDDFHSPFVLHCCSQRLLAVDLANPEDTGRGSYLKVEKFQVLVSICPGLLNFFLPKLFVCLFVIGCPIVY